MTRDNQFDCVDTGLGERVRPALVLGQPGTLEGAIVGDDAVAAGHLIEVVEDDVVEIQGGRPAAAIIDLRWHMLTEDELAKMWLLHKVMSPLESTEATELLHQKLKKTKNNEEFLGMMQKM